MQINCGGRARCSALCTGFLFCSRITLIPATKCKPVLARSRWSADPRNRIPPWLPISAPVVGVILGKTNLSEWANFRSFESISGWSGRGGQTNNPYGINRNPCGSSAGSGAAASANFAAVSFGSETDGSIVCPGNANGVAALKPTVGLVSRAGVVTISHTQDLVGPHGRTVADCAVALGVIESRTFDGRDPATGDVPPLVGEGCGHVPPLSRLIIRSSSTRRG